MANKENVEELIQALESGEFSKGAHCLHTPKEDENREEYWNYTRVLDDPGAYYHCCLGVARVKANLPEGADLYRNIYGYLELKDSEGSRLITLNDYNETWNEVIKYLRELING